MFERLRWGINSAGDQRERRGLPATGVVLLWLATVLGIARPSTADGLIFVRIPVVDRTQRAAGRPNDADSEPREGVPLGSHILRYDPPGPAEPGGRVMNLTPGFAAAGRPDVSFDGRRILFVARRKPHERLGMWEMNIDGTNARRITTEAGPCAAAIYVSTIYTIDADEPVWQVAFCAGSPDASSIAEPPDRDMPGGRPVDALFTCGMDGRRTRRITFTPKRVSDPYLLSDGRLVFSLGSALFTVNPDGTDVSVFAAAHETPARRGMPCETAGGEVVYVESANGDRFGGGALVAVKRARSLHTRRLVAGDADGLYHSPSPLPDGDLLVAFRRAADDSYGVYVLDPDNGTTIDRIIDTPAWHEVDAHVLAPRPVPAGRSSVVDDRVATGFLYCLNAYLSNTSRGERIAEGRIRRLQVFRARRPGDPNRARSAGEGTQPIADHGLQTAELLGDIPVEPDGSFFLEVPARTPIRLRTLDADGAVLQTMHSWIWVMPREGRGCVGCHEDRELSPPNRHPSALRQAPQRVGRSARR